MRTVIYWTVRHVRGAVRQRRFRLRCWWLSRQVDFLDWRLRLEPVLSSASSRADLAAMGQRTCHAVQSQ
jgi:hypothetical protein